MLDVFRDGYVTSGEFLAAYLTTMSSCRMESCKVILNKFRAMSGGEEKLRVDDMRRLMVSRDKTNVSHKL